MKSSLTRLLLGALALPPALAFPAAAAEHRFHDDHVLGTSFDLVIRGGDAAQALAALWAARAEIDRLDRVLSGWRDDSELSGLNRSTGRFAASSDLFEVIAACEVWRTATDGAFSARLGAVEAL